MSVLSGVKKSRKGIGSPIGERSTNQLMSEFSKIPAHDVFKSLSAWPGRSRWAERCVDFATLGEGAKKYFMIEGRK